MSKKRHKMDPLDDFLAVPETLSDSAYPQAPLTASLYAPSLNTSSLGAPGSTPLRPPPPPLITSASDEGYASTVQAWAHAFYRAVDQAKAVEVAAVQLVPADDDKPDVDDGDGGAETRQAENKAPHDEHKDQVLDHNTGESGNEDGEGEEEGDEGEEEGDEDEEDEDEEEVETKIRKPFLGHPNFPFSPDEVTIRDLLEGHIAVNCGRHEVQIPVLLSLLMMSIIGLSPATFFVTIGFGVPAAWLVHRGFGSLW